MSSSSLDWRAQLEAYLSAGHGRKDLLKAFDKLGDQNERLCHASLPLDLLAAFHQMPVFLEALHKSPTDVLSEADQLCLSVAAKISAEEGKTLPTGARVHLRPSRLLPDFCLPSVPQGSDAGSLLEMQGTVVRTTLPRMLERSKHLLCSKCRFSVLAHADYDQFFRLSKPTSCPKGCSGSQWSPATTNTDVSNPLLCGDVQEVKVQERCTALAAGAVPKSVWVTLEDDLVDVCKPGDDVTVVGVVRRRWHPLGR